jgi:hypothetical protein
MTDVADSRLSAGAYAPGGAPRVTPADIEATIVSESYSVVQSLTVCVLGLKNGTLITGESACVYPENFDAEIGRKIARERAVNKIWALEGYLLAQRRYEDALRYAGN